MDTMRKPATREQRTAPRVTIPEHPEVFDVHSGTAIGQLVNLSSGGLMIAGPACIERGSVHQFRIPLRQGQETVEIQLGAEALWCEDAHGSGTFWTGLNIIDISLEHLAIVRAVTGD
ncbi:MAG TPA: PilZ domain-containing protein [Gammaproteobacteria bacterium]|nr:PilZ domain-containing protein [Gammaproteobacteria bacterium]